VIERAAAFVASTTSNNLLRTVLKPIMAPLRASVNVCADGKQARIQPKLTLLRAYKETSKHAV